jgi:hypothetical protein
MKKQYTALKPFAHENSYCEKGATVELTDKQAEFLLAGEYVELINAAEPAAASAAKTKKTEGAAQ